MKAPFAGGKVLVEELAVFLHAADELFAFGGREAALGGDDLDAGLLGGGDED